MTRTARIKTLLEELGAERLVVEDVSHLHEGHEGYDKESHARLLVVWEGFRGQSRIARQRAIQRLLRGEWDKGLHALELRLLTPEEYQRDASMGGGSKSPKLGRA